MAEETPLPYEESAAESTAGEERGEVEKIISGEQDSSYEGEETTAEDILNPKTRKNLLVPEILEKSLGKVTRYSRTTGKRWIHLRVTSQIQSTSVSGATYTYIECLIKPHNGVGYDEVIDLEDLSSNIPQEGSLGVSGNVLYLKYNHTAVTQWMSSNNPSASPTKLIRIHFNSGYTRDVTVLFPLVTKTWMNSHFIGSFNNHVNPETEYQITDCDEETPEIYGIAHDFFRHQGSTTITPHYVFTKFGWLPGLDPGGAGVNLEWLSQYDSNNSLVLLRNGGAEWAADFLGGQPGSGSNGFVTPDYNETAPQEYHRIDVALQSNNTDFLDTINGQSPLDWAANNATNISSSTIFDMPEFSTSGENWYNSNDTTATPVISGTAWNTYLAEVANEITAYFSYSVYYAENITSCLVSPIYEYWVCDDDQNPSYYQTLTTDNGSTSASACNTITIPTTDVPGGSNYALGLVTLHHNPACCTVCTLLGVVQQLNQATYNTNDGAIKWSATDPSWGTVASGNSWSSGSMYTVTLVASNAQSIAQTMTAAGGSTTNVTSCVVNDTSGTENRVTCPSSTLVAPGQKIQSGHTWYDATSGGSTVSDVYVGDIITGTPGNNVTVFTVQDTYGTPVYSQSDATVTLAVGAGFYGEFHSLAPNTANGIGVGTYYTLTITDEDSCVQTINITIDEDDPISGCTDSDAINYNSSANIDDQSCLLCQGTATNDGLPLSDTNGSVTIPLFENSVINTTSTTNATTNDGTIDITTTMVASIQSVLFSGGADSSQTYTMTLYPVTTQNDFSTAGTALETKADIASTTFGASPQHIFGGGSGWGSTTSIPYGYYAIKVQFDDDDATLNIENCYTIFYATVKAKVCDTLGNDNYNTTVPAGLLEHDGTLCAAITQCCTLNGITLYDGAPPCTPILYVHVGCNPIADCGVTVQWEFDGGSGYQVIGSNSYVSGFSSLNSLATDTGLQGGLNWFAQYGSGNYRVTMTACYDISVDNGSSQAYCSETISQTFTWPISGCSDSTALNYDPLADPQCYGPCVFPSWECYAPGDCQDPWIVSGQDLNTYPGPGPFATYALCLADASCQPTPRLGCTDPCAINYDAIADVDDGSCYYGACLDFTADANTHYWDCDCNGGSYNYGATVNKLGCCTYSCSTDPTVTDVTVDSTGDCNGGTGGEVAITVTLTNLATTWEVYYENNIGTVINTDTTVYSSGDTATTVTGLNNGFYTAVITDNLLCVYEHNFSIGISGVDFGCMDPDDDCYDSNAICDDGTCCGICGCTDPNALNYDPNATVSCPCEYPSAAPSICVPTDLNKFLLDINSCLILNGTSWLNDHKIGFKEDCTTMDFWKLILIKYILDQDSLECVYNCVGQYIDIDLTDVQSSGILRGDCKALWAQGGPSTGINHDSAHQGTSGIPSTGEGTTVTQYDGFPSGWFGYNGSLSPSSNLTYEGDWITFDLPSGHYLSSTLNGTYWMLTTKGTGGTGLHQGCPNGKHTHYTQCCPYTTFTPIVLEPGVSYFDNFINFVNNFCKDCGTNILE